VFGRYKLLKAMLESEQGRFTVNDLAQLSGVNVRTIRTYLRREEGLLLEMGRHETGMRGGRYAVYRVNPNAVPDLRRKVRAIYDELGVAEPLLESTSEAKVEFPSGLLTAIDTLERRYPKADVPEQRQHLLEMARIDLRGASAEIATFRQNGARPSAVTALNGLSMAADYQVKLLEALGEASPIVPPGWLSKMAGDCLKALEAEEPAQPPRAKEETIAAAESSLPVAPTQHQVGEEHTGTWNPTESIEAATVPSEANLPELFVMQRVEMIGRMLDANVICQEAEKAAREFGSCFPDPPSWGERDDVRNRIAENLASTGPYLCLKDTDLAALGDEPAVYFPGVLRLGCGAHMLVVDEFFRVVLNEIIQRKAMPGRIGSQALVNARIQASSLSTAQFFGHAVEGIAEQLGHTSMAAVRRPDYGVSRAAPGLAARAVKVASELLEAELGPSNAATCAVRVATKLLDAELVPRAVTRSAAKAVAFRR
jgi:AcrR family transcriptional regulator